ncbi:MAG: gamma-glutamylcyclotransferase [Gammaproteobacteria bacterium]|nr:gamma-glutamylcyclotransferase [Gammaproteobacteria bacterium]
MAHVLFTYGTLSLPEVIHRVTGKCFPAVDALIEEYETYYLKNRPYPGMCYTGKGNTWGKLHFDIDAATFDLLDHYEGGEYVRQQITAVTTEGKSVTAQAYVLADNAKHLVSVRPWNEKTFRQRYLAQYLNEMEWRRKPLRQ